MGSRYSGTGSQVMYANETTWASEETADSYFGRAVNFNIDETNGIIKSRDIKSRDVQDFILGNYSVPITIKFEILNFSIFETIMGNSTGTGTGADPLIYTRTDGDIGSITIEAGHNGTTDNGHIVLGAKCNNASIDFAMNSVLTCATNWEGKYAKGTVSLQEYTVPTTAPFTYIHSQLQRNNTSIGIVQNGSIKLNNNLVKTYGIDSRLPQAITAGVLDLDWNATIVLDSDLDSTLRAEFYGQNSSLGPVDNDSTSSLTGFTMDLQLAASATRNATIALATAVIDKYGKSVDIGGNQVAVNVSGYAKTMTIYEQTTT